MIKVLTFLSVFVAVTSLSAGDKCFCNGSNYQPTYQNSYVETPYDYNNETTVNVVNRQISIAPAKGSYKNDPAVEKALKDQWSMLTNSIPISPAPQPLRQFQFNSNWPVTPAARPVQSRFTQTVQTQTVTQTLQGVIRQNLVVQGGAVAIDVPPAVIQQFIGR